MLKGENIVCFAGEDWWYHNPHSKNHLMRVFARYNRVLFLNSIGFRFPSPSDRAFAYRVLSKLKSYLHPPEEVEPNLIVASPVMLPFYSQPQLFVLGSAFLRLQIDALLRRYGFQRPILWVGMPTAQPILRHLRPKLVVYHYSDKFTAYDGTPRFVRALHERLIRTADLVVFAGKQLYAEESHKNPNSVLLPHGVDVDHFAKALNGAGPLPADLAPIPRPVAGFWGELNYSVDQRLVGRVAQLLPDVSFVFLGKVKEDVSRLESLPNVHFLGQKRYQELPDYARGFDVCILPLTVDHEYDRHRSPVKLREYLASGRPVVSVDYPEVRDWGGLVELAVSAEGFAEAIRRCLRDGAPGARIRRVQSVAGESWEARAAEISEVMRKLLERKGGGTKPKIKGPMPSRPRC